MSISVDVHLLSGKTESLEVHADDSVDSLRRRAQRALKAGNGRRYLLDGASTIKEARLQNGDALTLHVKQVALVATKGGNTSAFAAILGDGSVVTWGDAYCGGDNRAVQDQLRDVQQIQASRGAFAAILGDGSVVTWGYDNYVGNSSAVQYQLRDVQQIQSSDSVVTWGDAYCGGDNRAVQDQLRDVEQIQASRGALLQSWVMDQTSLGVMTTMVATAARYSTSCEMCSRSDLLMGICCHPE